MGKIVEPDEIGCSKTDRERSDTADLGDWLAENAISGDGSLDSVAAVRELRESGPE